AIVEGASIPPYYDSMIAKLIILGADRHEAIARARRALAEFDVDGVPTTLPFHRWVLDQHAFADNTTSTRWAEAAWAERGAG
ncbi:MAG: hypothetical protein ACTS8Z_08615, partial [Candidatus Limnocylindrales bacterium]